MPSAYPGLAGPALPSRSGRWALELRRMPMPSAQPGLVGLASPRALARQALVLSQRCSARRGLAGAALPRAPGQRTASCSKRLWPARAASPAAPVCWTADGLLREERLGTVRRAAQSRKLPAPLAPSVPSRPLRHSRHPTAGPGHGTNSSSTPDPACRLPDSSDRESRERERRLPPYYSISWRCRTGRGTYRPG